MVSNSEKLYNLWMKAMLYSPFHKRFSSQILVLAFSGRKSGKRYTTPLSYYREAGAVFCFTRHPWQRNLIAQPAVKLRLAGRTYGGMAQVISADLPHKTDYLGKMLMAIPGDAKWHRVPFNEDGSLDQEALQQAAGRVSMIKISLAD